MGEGGFQIGMLAPRVSTTLVITAESHIAPDGHGSETQGATPAARGGLPPPPATLKATVPTARGTDDTAAPTPRGSRL